MQSDQYQGELRQLSADELRHITGGNAGLGALLSSIFSGINVVVKAIESVIVAATHNNPAVVSGINTFNNVGMAVENAVVGIATVV